MARSCDYPPPDLGMPAEIAFEDTMMVLVFGGKAAHISIAIDPGCSHRWAPSVFFQRADNRGLASTLLYCISDLHLAVFCLPLHVQSLACSNMPTSQVSGASHGSSNKKSKTARAKESKSRVDDYLAEEGSLYERIPNDSKAKDRTKAYKDRAWETTRDADRRLGSR